MAKNYICAHCGTQKKPTYQAQHSLIGEVLLWLVMLVIGPVTGWISVVVALIYSIWRAVSKKTVCAACGKDKLVDVSTPRGERLRAEYSNK